MKLLGKDIRFLGMKLSRRNLYVGVYHGPSTAYYGRHFIAVSPIPFVTFQFTVGNSIALGNHDPVSAEGWFRDGVTWGDQ